MVNVTASQSIWVSEQQLYTIPCPPKYQSWLTHRSGLSQAFKQQCQQFNIDVVSQQFDTPSQYECFRLNIPYTDQALVRCSMLCGDQSAWCYARTIIPSATYQHYQEEFEALGNQPIGEQFIYRQNFTRGPLQIASLSKKMDENCSQEFIPILSTYQDPLWARNFKINLTHGPLLITEVFLPEVPNYPHQLLA